MYGMYKLVISPQQFIEAGGGIDDIMRVFEQVGLHSIEICPFKRIKCRNEEEDYYVTDEERFYLARIDSFGGGYGSDYSIPCEQAILVNFLPGWPHHPLVAYIYYGEFENPEVALNAYEIKPFRHDPKDADKKPDHALLIVGVDNTHSDEEFHYCLVKNSQGPKWGKDGFSKVAFSVIKRVDVPQYSYDQFLKDHPGQIRGSRS
ncbi:hypothetical protein CTI12_AA073470 [Artemisia annua]|uniref:Peptidase C1A papain C-terminal domain-containing protein n=1 Tax=Artemisia annua TaxID=35608 RepID=A0A2U1Q5H0_ARTAN|nr:hypothetical protein CTI12_AA073470 [Artemisia annua]